MRNKKDPSIELRGTPNLISGRLELNPFIKTNCFQLLI